MDRRNFLALTALSSLAACGGDKGTSTTPNASAGSGTGGASVPTPASVPTAGSLASQQTDQYIASLRQTWGAVSPSISLAVLKDGNVVKQAAYGYRQIDPPLVADDQTDYLLASVTKQFTAAALMVMVQNGQASVDDYLSQYFTLPGGDPNWLLIQLHHLLTHTAGLPRYSPMPGVDLQNAGSPEQAMASFTQIEGPLKVPGAAYLYSDVGYGILGMVMRKIAGKYPASYPKNTFAPSEPPTYNNILQTLLFGPQAANMPNTGIDFQEGKSATLAVGYGWSNETWVVTPAYNRPVGAGLISSRLSDLAIWERVLLNTTILSEASKQKMWSPTLLNNGKTATYGFGWELGETMAGGVVIYHDGDAADAFNSAFYRFVDSGYTVIVLINMQRNDAGYGGGLPDTIAEQVAMFYSPDLAFKQT
ncbi:serine hydrolase [Paraburkholderia sediminicola]|uniref:serine hydrolase domain-containing protein n=1 Tax=Paraburkholderia sediminicola TaxID=458836 RepID=UPI0038BCDF1E